MTLKNETNGKNRTFYSCNKTPQDSLSISNSKEKIFQIVKYDQLLVVIILFTFEISFIL